MALSRATFLERFPEFSVVPTTNVDAALAKAEGRVDREVWESAVDVDYADGGVGYLAAADLRRTQGDAAAGPPEEYRAEYLEMRRVVGIADGGW